MDAGPSFRLHLVSGTTKHNHLLLFIIVREILSLGRWQIQPKNEINLERFEGLSFLVLGFKITWQQAEKQTRFFSSPLQYTV